MPTDTITTRVAEEITIRLAAAPAAGYAWELDPLPAGLTLPESAIRTPEPGQPPGSPTQQEFRLRAEVPGEYALTFRYKRPWESTALQSRTITLVVR